MSARKLVLGGPVSIAVILVIAALLVGYAGQERPALAADAEQRVMISERMQLTGPTTQAGTWVGTGAVNDAGAGMAIFTVVPHGDDKGLLRGTHVLTGSSGTITIETTAFVRPFPPHTPPRAMAEGTWKIVSGTGAYADLQGRGKVYATADFTTGEITIVRDGNAN
ncbi:MAG: hypothetical protein ACRDKA_05425 [Actinomycetota bacterium]